MHRWLLFLLFLAGLAHCYKQDDFKTCHQSPFCNRQRMYESGKSVTMGPYKNGGGDMIMEFSSYRLVNGAWNFNSKAKGHVTAQLSRSFKRYRSSGIDQAKALEEEGEERVTLKIDRYAEIGWRVRLEDKEPRWNQVADEVTLPLNLIGVPVRVENGKKATLLSSDADSLEEYASLLILHDPFEVILYNQKLHIPVIQINANGRFNMENGYLKGGHLDDKFKSWTDNVKKGRLSLGLDFTFPSSNGVHGIPEHATDFNLKNTDGTQYSEPYRLYNLDVFEYELDMSVALYGSVPFIYSHSEDVSAGVLWINPSETWVDVSSSDANPDFTRLSGHFAAVAPKSTIAKAGKEVHFMSETGALDVFLFPGPLTHVVSSQYARVVGTPALPPIFAIGYHQCRWNYKDELDVFTVDKEMDSAGFPFDVIWLDIEHTDGKKYFTWDQKYFPNPKKMIETMAKKNRKMVTIVDPHIKEDNDYYVYKQAKDQGLAVTSNSKDTFVGHCWPGSSIWIDYTNEAARLWWSELFSLAKYKGSSESLFVWNDMNEPSVFSGPEITMPKDNNHADGREHREVHNIYGMLQQRATAEGLVKRNKGDRPFVLSRAFFIGTQRYGAIWTGDNTATWSHLEASVPMLLSLNIAGIMFSGADVGGFFGNPDPELLTRWYQLAVYQPFFRGHAHIETKRREPYLLSEPFSSAVRNAIRERGQLLPYLYTTFYQAHVTGSPIMRPFFFEFPGYEESGSVGYLLGKSMAVFPVTLAGQSIIKIKLPESVSWFSWRDWTAGAINGGEHTLSIGDSVIDSIPVYVRSGTILPVFSNPRRTIQANYNFDNISLVIFPSNGAVGHMFFDDGQTFNYLSGYCSYSVVEFAAKPSGTGFVISNKLASQEKGDARGAYADPKNYQASYPFSSGGPASSKSLGQSFKRKVDRISIVLPNNVAAKVKRVKSSSSNSSKVVFWTTTGKKDSLLEIKWPDTIVSENWTIDIDF